MRWIGSVMEPFYFLLSAELPFFELNPTADLTSISSRPDPPVLVGWSGLVAPLSRPDPPSTLLVTDARSVPPPAESPVSATAIPARAAAINRPVVSSPAHAVNRKAEPATTPPI